MNLVNAEKGNVKKGFVLTLDAIAATLILLVVVLIIANQVFTPLLPRGVYLKQVSLDVLTIAEKNGNLERLANGNGTAIRELVEAMPESMCAELQFTEYGSSNTTAIPKPGCTSYDKSLQVAYRTYRYNGRNYIVRLNSWYRGA